jgi:hypothetical protein
MRKQIVSKIILLFIITSLSSETGAQIDQSPYGQQDQRRSIWDKEPEPKTDPAPFGSNPLQQPAGNASLQQNGALADPPGFGTNTQDGVPIDGGLSLLMAAGALYGAKKAYRKGKRKQVEN